MRDLLVIVIVCSVTYSTCELCKIVMIKIDSTTLN